MSDLGQQLKEARMSRGLSLDDVQEMTKIRKRYLEAIEAGDYKVLPGSFYVRAFIKTYAEAVGVNPDDLLTEHQQDVPVPEAEPTMEPVLQRTRTKTSSVDRNAKWLSTTLMWSFAVIIVVVIYLVVVYSNKGDEKQAVDQTPVTNKQDQGTSTAPSGDAKDKADTDSKSNTQDPAGGGSTGTDTAPGTEQGDAANQQGTTPPQEGTGQGTNDNTQTPVTEGVTVSENGRKGSAALFNVQSPNSAPVKVVITASGASWVEVRRGDKSGEKLYYQNTKDGEVLSYDLDSQGLYIKSGASSRTVITVGGQVVDDGRNTSKIQLELTAPNGSPDNSAGNGGAEGDSGDGTTSSNEGNGE
ncbi:helix-turn-helix domain-containing protein [Paenibacillus sp. CAA11]|uniref:RodZ domain-containing protein n=1 Tax=Paenibacillus sp. CAA11 TaxID=1532905 RepID=UPI000D386345|nr:RodZ domain-containing protein [Paenibacillus sp. CAA11]AWB44365.1 helix-turn-helix domain-containing protein [Paenibacillus sp. CAA11]